MRCPAALIDASPAHPRSSLVATFYHQIWTLGRYDKVTPAQVSVKLGLITAGSRSAQRVRHRPV